MKEASCDWKDTISWYCILCGECKLEYVYSGVNFCGENVYGVFFGEILFLPIAGKIWTRKNVVPQGISSLSKLCLFCWQHVAICAENNKKIVAFVGEKLQRIWSFLLLRAIPLSLVRAAEKSYIV